MLTVKAVGLAKAPTSWMKSICGSHPSTSGARYLTQSEQWLSKGPMNVCFPDGGLEPKAWINRKPTQRTEGGRTAHCRVPSASYLTWSPLPIWESRNWEVMWVPEDSWSLKVCNENSDAPIFQGFSRTTPKTAWRWSWWLGRYQVAYSPEGTKYDSSGFQNLIKHPIPLL